MKNRLRARFLRRCAPRLATQFARAVEPRTFTGPALQPPGAPPCFAPDMSTQIPDDLKYAKSHEWLRVTGDTATVGITDHAQHELTDVVFVELPAVGRQLKAGEACAVVESVKTASDIYSPASGEVIAINQAVTDNPALVNSAPYADGWFFQLKLANAAEASALLTPDAYWAQIGG